MASVFLSYDRKDRSAARLVARALQTAGHDVWWDQQIRGGAEFSREIERALARTDAVVVLWSRESIESPWVRDEAASGRDRGRLVPVSLDDAQPPLGFRQFQTLPAPGGKLNKSRLRALLAALDAVIGATTPIPARPAVQWRLPTGLIAALVILAVTAAALVFWQPSSSERGEIILAVMPSTTDPASQSLAQDLIIKLGALNASTALPVRTVEATESKSADLVFAVAASNATDAALTLKSGRDSSILWSRDFQQPSGNHADLIQQLSFTAARVADCASEGLDGSVRLKPKVLRTYLNACAQLAEILGWDPRGVEQALGNVVAQQPKFTPAWAKLLRVELDVVQLQVAGSGRAEAEALATLKKHLAEAEAIDPTMPAVAVGKTALLAPTEFRKRMQLLDMIYSRHRSDPEVLDQYSGALAAVGRSQQAVETAAEAARLDPLSPARQAAYIAALTYAGSFEAARRELDQAERLWPGAATVRQARFRFHLRYGDAKIARRIFDQDTDLGGTAPRLYMETRLDPSPVRIARLLAYVRERLANMENPRAGLGFAVQAFAHFGDTDELMSLLLNWRNPEDLAQITDLWFRPHFDKLRQDPRFPRLAMRVGLLDYWRASGKWPDFCFEPGQPYDCKTEAAKLAA